MSQPADASLSICVFCGASPGNSSEYRRAGYALGRQLGLGHHRLIYGAGGIGIMGAVARGASDHGAKIVGIIPAFLKKREMNDEIPPQEVIVTDDLAQRKGAMLGMSDGFIALPGGYGTLDEVLEVVSMNALDQDYGPVVLLNINGFWDPFVAMIDGIAAQGFAHTNRPFTVVDSPEAAIAHIRAAYLGHPDAATLGNTPRG